MLCPLPLLDLIPRCWSTNPVDRPNASQIVLLTAPKVESFPMCVPPLSSSKKLENPPSSVTARQADNKFQLPYPLNYDQTQCLEKTVHLGSGACILPAAGDPMPSATAKQPKNSANDPTRMGIRVKVKQADKFTRLRSARCLDFLETVTCAMIGKAYGITLLLSNSHFCSMTP
ncbi:unnamed protein product [Protopolystoma xenopodis]|uniref:Uncharacterized protein n=1 Tax=Protopolystoma xenopodis TaxID=117903 RepID=A0A3S5AEB0_9PLAT|nr:unnamed protein product [Protopolystoma xenopodis]